MAEFAQGNHPLPFNEAFQEAVVGHCLTDSKFFVKCSGRLQPQWFSKNFMLGTLFSQLCILYKHDGIFITSVEEFKNHGFFLEQLPPDREKYYNLIGRCVLSSKNFSVDKIEQELTGFLRVSLFKESVEGAAQRFKAQGFQTAYEWTRERINQISAATFEDDEFIMNFDNPLEYIDKQATRRGSAISTGCSVLDQALGGGLFKKETCAFMAPSNVGKTTGMITIARHAIWQKLDVLFLIHEGDPEEIRFRLLCSFLGVTPQTLFEWTKDNEKRRLINGVAAFINMKLTYVPYIKTGGMFVEDVVELIKKLNTERKIKTGKGYDIVIDDYPKKLKSRARSGSREGLYRVEAAEIYDSFNHLATELNVHCFVAIQTNRTGLKQNNNKVESSQLLGMEEIDEAFGIAQNLANIITLNRSPEDRQKNILRINVAKSRNHKTDIAINTRTRYDCFLTFGDKNMFDGGAKGMKLNTDLEIGYLESDSQDHNTKEATSIIDNQLSGKELKAKEIPQGSNTGVAAINGKLEA